MKKLSNEIIEQARLNSKPVKEKKESKFVSSIFEWMQAIAIAIVAVVILMTFVCRVVNIDGRSMMNTLLDEDKILVYTLLYTPEAGDVVVISHAENYEEPIVKRVIAKGGQTVDIDFASGKVYVDGIVLDEPYIDFAITKRRTDDDMQFPLTVPDGYLFVLGDNRPESLDGRCSIIGFINEDDVIGKAVAIVSPLERITFIR